MWKYTKSVFWRTSLGIWFRHFYKFNFEFLISMYKSFSFKKHLINFISSVKKRSIEINMNFCKVVALNMARAKIWHFSDIWSETYPKFWDLSCLVHFQSEARPFISQLYGILISSTVFQVVNTVLDSWEWYHKSERHRQYWIQKPFEIGIGKNLNFVHCFFSETQCM